MLKKIMQSKTNKINLLYKKPKNGTHSTYYENGERVEATYKNGQIDGEYKILNFGTNGLKKIVSNI